MLALTLALAAAAPTVIDAERAFAQMAQDKGQWTAFRAYAAPDAVMFTPQPVNAQEFLKARKDPPKAIRWQPIQAWVSCDGTLAVDTGNWQSSDGKTVGYFTTVWKRQDDGSWKWVYDGGDGLNRPRPTVANPEIIIAQCHKSVAVPQLVNPAAAKEFYYAPFDGTMMANGSFNRDGSRDFAVRISVDDKVTVVLENHVAPAK
ncbi:MAG TPA: nuclear transport factor 2 family protein [Sphingomonas sp.]|jgi:hypothetical protein|nr:nuclear transport factor 2 family protein [Sphingomonas sp.]